VLSKAPLFKKLNELRIHSHVMSPNTRL